jgi:hypothetical protein
LFVHGLRGDSVDTWSKGTFALPAAGSLQEADVKFSQR